MSNQTYLSIYILNEGCTEFITKNLVDLRILIFLLFGFSLSGQQDPHFTSFEGDVVKIPARHCMKAMGFGDHVAEYEIIGNVSWESIQIPNSNTTTPFPDVERIDRFGLILTSDMYIAQAGCYNFTLESDDGSRFWIEDQEIIDNDGVHAMELKAGKVFLNRGKYKIKLWYHQAFIHKYGFVFNAKYLGSDCQEFSDTFSTLKPNVQKLSFNNDLLFDVNSSILSQEGKQHIKAFFDPLELNFETIKIHGYTCDLGTSAFNRVLSQKRAEAVEDYLISTFDLGNVKIISVGFGESLVQENPKTENERKKLRKVEILLN